MGKMQSMRDFSGGVMNQELQNRDDGRGIIISANNVVSSTNGELRKRTGVECLAELPYKAKLIPFRLPNGNDVILAFMQRGDGANADVGKVIGYNYTDAETTRFYNILTGAVPAMPSGDSWTGNTNGDWTIGSDFPLDTSSGHDAQLYAIFKGM